MLRNIFKIDLFQYVYINYLCKNVKRNGRSKIVPYRNSIIRISKSAEIILNDSFYINTGKFPKSKAEAFFVIGGKLIVNGKCYLRYGSTLQVNNNAVMELGGFTCNVGINIQCNNHIIMGKDCMIGRNVVIYDSSYHPSGTNPDFLKISEGPVKIGNHVWLGANVIITHSSEIGDGSVVGTGAMISGKYNNNVLVTTESNKAVMNGIVWARSLNEKDILSASEFYDRIPDNISLIDDENLKNEVIECLTKVIDNVNFSTEEALVDSKLIDSLGLVSIVGALADRFNIDIPFEEICANNFNSADRITSLICRLKKSNFTSKQKQVAPDVVVLEDLALDDNDVNKTVVQRIFDYSQKNPSDIAIIAEEKKVPYKEFVDNIVVISNYLKSIGICSGERVIVQAMHDSCCIATYYAVQLSGCILVPVEKTAGENRVLEIAQDTSASMIISNQKYNISINNITFKTLRELCLNKVEYLYEEIKFPNIDSPCEMVFTTGTTGKSKGVLMTHRSNSWYANALAKSIKLKKGNRFLITTPLNHAGGLRRTHLSLANGCCVVYLDGISNLSKYFEYIRNYGVSSLYLPPVAIRILLTQSKDELSKYKNQIDFVYSSSSPLPVGDCEELKKLLPNSRLYNAYEASETPGVCVYNYNEQNTKKDCIGIPNEGVEIGVLTESGHIENKSSMQGKLCIKSKMNMQEYYGATELTKSVTKDGWFVSNDLILLDSQGFCYYKGREGDVINIGGYKINPSDVEEKALKSHMVKECVLVEKKDKYNVSYTSLLIVPEHNYNQTELLSYLEDSLENYKIPRMIEIVEAVEKTFNGKINRKFYR